LRKNGECPLCNLISESVATANGGTLSDDTECLLEWVIDGRQEDSSDRYIHTSRRIRISWDGNIQNNKASKRKPEELYLLRVQSPTSYVLDSSTSVKESDSEILKHEPEADIVDTIRKWVKECEHHHKAAFNIIRQEDIVDFLVLIQRTSFCVVDVLTMQLTRLPIDEKTGKPKKYVALSYVWGSKDLKDNHDYKTLRSNVIDRVKPDGLNLKKLPLTLRNAIELVQKLRKELDIRYIWIDALCIVQDNISAWRINAENMYLIFGNAHFTICAADGDAYTGLVAMDPNQVYHPEPKEIKPDLQFLVSRPSESIIQATDWNRRAWTFQERILSRRCLVFATKRIYFQCRLTNKMQDIGQVWCSDWRKSPLRTLKELETRPIRFYMACIELYTGRQLSFAKDILNAFNGVSRLMEEYMGAQFFFGMPSSHFDFALLWRPTFGKVRRRLPPECELCKVCDCRSSRHEQEVDEFPSWSWSGWRDVEDKGIGTAVFYSEEFLDGCLTNLHNWLKYHTWIQWYIRDSHGVPKPLWKGYPSIYPQRKQTIPLKWKGYVDVSNNSDHSPDTNDSYGRPLRDYGHRRPPTSFDTVFSDNPLNLQSTPAGTLKSPYQPILHFYTWRCVFRTTPAPESQQRPDTGLTRLDILDANDDWVGTVVVDSTLASDEEEFVFIALADAKGFTDEECGSWNYYIPKEREDSEWDLFYVMCIQESGIKELWERVGLGKVFQTGFEKNGGRWAEIALG
jgi:Heterokaryon incompatibility protein (HET)